MNYNSVEEILSSGTTNMTVIRNNSKNNDGTDTITGVNWFTFNGTVASTIYASGNSWIGFGSPSEHLKVNRRNSAVWSIYREEGTLYDYYKFLKIRWKGYSHYGSTSFLCAVEYDVILWDTGDISLHMISIPSSYNSGTYSLTAGSTYSYAVSTSSPDVTFIKSDSGFTVNTGIIELIPVFEKRYLIKIGTTLYTVIDGALSALSTTDLTSNTFLTYGVSELTIDFISKCSSGSEILVWYETTNYGAPTGITIFGTPPLPQVVGVDINTGTTTTISNVEPLCSDDVIFTVSHDGTNKYYYDTSTNTWILADSDMVGMSLTSLINLTTTEWSTVPNSDDNSVFYIYALLPTENSYCKSFYYNTAKRTV
jgi:hypothetical protein